MEATSRPQFDAVLMFIHEYSGKVTGIDVAMAFPVESKIYGRQQFTSALIARFRHAGFIKDCDRCQCCKRALTRGERNVPLHITEKGIQYLVGGK
jgi:hypothetical protein